MITVANICSHLLFFLGLYGLLSRRDNLVISLICLEMSLLGVALLFISSSVSLDDNVGLLVFFILLVLAGVESALGLALVIVYYRARTSVSWSAISAIKG